MYKQFLTAVSVIALMGVSPAMADKQMKTDGHNPAKPGSAEAAAQSTGHVGQDIENAWGEIKDDSSKAYKNVKQGTKDVYKDIKATLMNDDMTPQDMQDVEISTRTTAEGMIGQPVYNSNERVGTIKDIILNESGEPTMVIVADGDFFGMGKLAAFDYNRVVNKTSSGDIVVPLTEQTIDQAAEFSYDRGHDGQNVMVIPGNGYSVAELLDGQLVDAQGETLAQIEDIQFKNGEAAHLIVGFNQILGLGGDKAAMSYDTATIVQDDRNNYDFQLAEGQSSQFESYKKSMMN